MIPLHHLLEARLEEGHAALAQAFDSRLIHINTGNAVAQVGEDGCCYESDVTGSDNTDIHVWPDLPSTRTPFNGEEIRLRR
jgi:hypothetical protein